MKLIPIYFILICLFFVSCDKLAPTTNRAKETFGESATVKNWKDNRLAMMIHFGLYSQFGGVYKGQNIVKGYSEQIMAHAPIPSEEYKAAASSFNPVHWKADEIVSLAKEGGFKSIVITSKHHDGFSMFDSQFSDFTIVKSTPFKRDIVKELSDACLVAGIGFGVYFSLIDWNAKEGATVISDHNADAISPALHQNNLNQIRELCTNYGNLSELWFDMGSLTLAQSTEIRKLVKDLQPNCMIGGRLGNGQGDFNVLGDNELAGDLKFDQPWQTVNSIYADTWGYRSWSIQGDAEAKAQEHLNRIINTTLKGGNYTLNIGPKGDGSIDDFEKRVIQKIGTWINTENGQAIYGTRPLPGGLKGWGGLTYNPPNIYAILTSRPDESRFVTYGINTPIKSASRITAPNESIAAIQDGPSISFDLGLLNLQFNPATIFKISYEGELSIAPAKQVYSNSSGVYELYTQNSTTYYGMEGTNYYTNVPVVTKYTWDIASPKDKEYEIILYYTQQEKGEKINLNINGHIERVDLSKYKTFKQEQNTNKCIPSAVYTQGPYPGNNMTSHKGPLNWAVPAEPWGEGKKTWFEVPNFEQGKITQVTLDSMNTYYYLINILAYARYNHIIAVGADDAFMAYLNGNLMHSSGFPHPEPNVVFLDLPLEQESNTLIFKHMNTGGTYKTFFTLLIDQIRFEKSVSYTKLNSQKTNHIEVTQANPTFPNENLNCPNIKIIIQEKKNNK